MSTVPYLDHTAGIDDPRPKTIAVGALTNIYYPKSCHPIWRLMCFTGISWSSLPTPAYRDLQLIRYVHDGKCKTLKILVSVSPHWKNVGGVIGLGSSELANIANPGSGKPPEDCLRDVFSRWFDNAPHTNYPLTWKGVHNILRDSDYGSVVKDLKEALSSPYSSIIGTYDKGGVSCHMV